MHFSGLWKQESPLCKQSSRQTSWSPYGRSSSKEICQTGWGQMIGLHPPKDFRMNTRIEEVRVKGNPMRQQSGTCIKKWQPVAEVKNADIQGYMRMDSQAYSSQEESPLPGKERQGMAGLHLWPPLAEALKKAFYLPPRWKGDQGLLLVWHQLVGACWQTKAGIKVTQDEKQNGLIMTTRKL